MENFLTTIVFLLPGFLMYFWIQSFGVNPVVKHSSIELTAISALLWLPVSFLTLALYNGIIHLSTLMDYPVWTLEQLEEVSGNFLFLTTFLVLSVIVSFLFGALWAKFIFPLQLKLVNSVRVWRGVAKFSKNTSVWDEVFLNNDAQVVELGRIGDEHKVNRGYIGEIKKASRTFESERNILLNDMEFFTDLVKRHDIPVSTILLDSKTGIYIKVFNQEKVIEAQLKDRDG